MESSTVNKSIPARPPSGVISDEKTLREQGKRIAFKHALDSPFFFKWPSIASQDHDSIINEFQALVKPLNEYHSTKKNDNSTKPPIYEHILVGINETTHYLDKTIPKSKTTQKITSSDDDKPPKLPIKAILLCKGDLAPSQLYQHIPSMAYLCPSKPVLIPLNKGSEAILSKAMGLKRVACVGILESESTKAFIESCTSKVALPDIPWLSAANQQNSKKEKGKNVDGKKEKVKIEYQPTHVKTIQTTAPMNRGKKRQREDKNESSTATPNPKQLKKDVGKDDKNNVDSKQ